MSASWRIVEGDCREALRAMPEGSARCCVTSPPYWGLRDYGHAGQLGLESTPEQYVANMVEVFREVRRVLADDGTLWLNLGDSYSVSGCGGNPPDSPHQKQRSNRGAQGQTGLRAGRRFTASIAAHKGSGGLKPKNLVGIPWLVAFALRADGWYLRADIIWSKPNPMPESVRDRPTKAHEYVFLFAKSDRYFYDYEAVKEAAVSTHGSGNGFVRDERLSFDGRGNEQPWTGVGGTRNRRSVWTIATRPFAGAHFATMPTELVEPCVLAGSATGDTVIDPFAGAGTVGLVANRLGRSFVGVELNPQYAAIARERIAGDAPLFNARTA